MENKRKNFKTDLRTDTPIQMYAVSKKATELISYSYNFQYKIPVVLLRFLQFMDLGDDLIWHFLNSQKNIAK